MSWSKVVRKSHRWLSIAFTVTVIINVIAMATGRIIEWLYMLPLAPLMLLVPSGLYMFFEPYTGKSQSQRSTSNEV